MKITINDLDQDLRDKVTFLDAVKADKKPGYLKYDNGTVTISPEAFSELEPGDYYLGFYFDDPLKTTVKDKVCIKVVRSGIPNGDKDSSDANKDTEKAEETEKTKAE